MQGVSGESFWSRSWVGEAYVLLFRACRSSPASTRLAKGLMADLDDEMVVGEHCER
jgi:hypothetical protein